LLLSSSMFLFISFLSLCSFFSCGANFSNRKEDTISKLKKRTLREQI
jgi:hypothetical protein